MKKAEGIIAVIFLAAGLLILGALASVSAEPAATGQRALSKGFTAHDPIYINGNNQFTTVNGVTSGSGTEADPYIIESWDITATNAHGIEIEHTDKHFIIRNCIVRDSSGTDADGYAAKGIFFENVVNGKIYNATVYNITSSPGISVWYSSNINIINCNVYDNYDCGITFFGTSNSKITNCTIHHHGQKAVYIYSPISGDPPYNNNQVADCTIYNCGVGGIEIESASDTNISGCKIYNARYGLILTSASNTAIDNCQVNNTTEEGVHLYSSSNNVFNKCEFYNNPCGIIFYAPSINYPSWNSTINSSQFHHNGNGIQFVVNGLSSNSHTIFFANNITNCAISNNTYGINITFGANDNLIYHNNFIDNTYQAYDECSNNWDHYPEGGNHWSDWTTPDANGDGFVDKPYLIPGGSNQDNYPLASEIDLTSPTVKDTIPPTTTATLSGTAGDNGWYVSSVTVTLTASDTTEIGPGWVAYTKYRINGGTWTTYTQPVILERGVFTMDYYTVDKAENAESIKNVTIKTDTADPQSQVYPIDGPNTPYINGSSFNVEWGGSDELSGIAFYVVEYKIGINSPWQTLVEKTTDTNTTFSGLPNWQTAYFRCLAVDMAGNVEDWPASSEGDAHAPNITEWIITEPLNIQNEIIDLNPEIESIIITETGCLRLTNVTLTTSASISVYGELAVADSRLHVIIPSYYENIYDSKWPRSSNNRWHLNIIAQNGSVVQIKNTTIEANPAGAKSILSGEHYGIIYADEQADIILENSAFYANTSLHIGNKVFDAALYTKSKNTLIQNCRFYDNLPSGYASRHIAVYAENNAQLRISGCYFADQYHIYEGIYLVGTGNPIEISDTDIAGFNTGVFTNQVSQLNIRNTTIAANPRGADIDLYHTNLNLLNATYTNLITYRDDTVSTINILQYLNVHVIGAGKDVSDAEIAVRDVNGNTVFTGKTGQDGWVRNVPILQSTWHNQVTTTFTPHNITAAKGTTKTISEVIDQYKIVTLSLSGAILTAALEVQPASLTNQELRVWVTIKSSPGSYESSGNITVELYKDAEAAPFSTLVINSLAPGEETRMEPDPAAFSTAGAHTIRAELSSDRTDDAINTPIQKDVKGVMLHPVTAPSFLLSFETFVFATLIISALFIIAARKGGGNLKNRDLKNWIESQKDLEKQYEWFKKEGEK